MSFEKPSISLVICPLKNIMYKIGIQSLAEFTAFSI